MRKVIIVALALISSAFAHQKPEEVLHRRAPHLQKRDATTTYLPNIVALSPQSCNSTCTPFITAVEACATSGGTDEAIATCSCSQAVLTKILTCVQCDQAASDNVYGTQTMLQYNGFVTQCISVGLASSSALVSVPAATATQTISSVLNIYPTGSSSIAVTTVRTTNIVPAASSIASVSPTITITLGSLSTTYHTASTAAFSNGSLLPSSLLKMASSIVPANTATVVSTADAVTQTSTAETEVSVGAASSSASISSKALSGASSNQISATVLAFAALAIFAIL
ncbi:hypothetical protein T439DRAFT_353673 [Meredithblackwellia eburnea MCA 4105]